MRQSNRLLMFLLAVALDGCGSRGNPGSGLPTDTPSAPAPAPPAVASAPRNAEPAASAAPRTSDSPREPAPAVETAGAGRPPLSVACYSGFAPSTVPRVDVVRLGVSCGPSTGLTEFGHLAGVVDEAVARGPILRWDAGRGDCFRLFAAASEPVEDLEAEVRGPKGSSRSLTNQNRRWLVAGGEGPFCAEREGQFEAEFRTHAGRGAFAATVWRGAHMVGKHRAKGDGLGTEPVAR